MAKQSAADVATRGKAAFQTIALGSSSTQFEPVSASPGFRDITNFQGSVVISAQAGLFVYDANGSLKQRYRSGIELPSAPLGMLSAGVAAGGSGPVLAVATAGAGLLLFDGQGFRQILPGEAGLRTITAVRILRSGRILFGTRHNGLHVFDGKSVTAIHPRLASEHITALSGDEGDLWIGTLQHGVFHDRGGQLDDLRSDLPDPQVLSLTQSGKSAYVGTPLGVVAFQDGRRQRVLADGYFAKAVSADEQLLFVGTQDEGITQISLGQSVPRSGRREDPEFQKPVERIVTLDQTRFALTSDALHRFDVGRHHWQAVLQPEPSVLSDRNVSALGWSEGRLWVGYFDRGLDLLSAGFDSRTHLEDERLFCVNRIVPDLDQHRTAVATANGLVLFDASGKQRQVLGRKEGLLSDHVTDVAFQGRTMTVATPAGLSFVDDAGIRGLYVFHGLVNNHVYAVAASRRQTLAGTLGGVSVLEQERVLANYMTSNSRLKHNWVTALAEVGDEWFAGTYGSGVMRLDKSGQWQSFPDLREGFVVNPNAMLVTPDAVYAGSLDQGLYMYSRATQRWTRTTAGLPSLNVTAFAAGGGQLFIGTDNGLVKIAQGALR